MSQIDAKEIARLLYAKQGCLFVGSNIPRSIGEITNAAHDVDENRLSIPMRIVAKATRAEWKQQLRALAEIDPESIYDDPDYPFLYRAEACD